MPLRQYVGLLGVLLALAGIALDSRLVVWVAAAVLGAATLLRVLPTLLRRYRKDDWQEPPPDA